jgi:TRAP-type C4-dicarboxylate transport system substrate-binding protein
VTQELTKSGLDERADVEKLSQSLKATLADKGMKVIEVERVPFRDALRKTSYYKDWKAKFGEQGWGLLEKSVGTLT